MVVNLYTSHQAITLCDAKAVTNSGNIRCYILPLSYGLNLMVSNNDDDNKVCKRMCKNIRRNPKLTRKGSIFK
jgi:hypothetical protein